MMKKISVLIMLLLVVSLNVFADEPDGYFWQKLSTTQKTSVIFGYVIAFGTVQDFCRDSYSKVESQPRTEKTKAYMEMMQMMEEWAKYPMTVNVLMGLVEKYYSDPANLEDPFILVFPYVCDKEWW
jgi:hypothetical protein